MIIGALVDAGLSMDALERELRRLPVAGWSLRARRVNKQGLAALYFDVDVPGEDGKPLIASAGAAPEHHHGQHDHHHEGIAHRKLSDVLDIVRSAHFPEAVEKTAMAIYKRLAQAEARVHGQSVEEIAFHEVGQIDAIVDIAGAALGLHMLGIEEVYCSALPCGQGRIRSAHGTMPSPAPATMELLREIPTYQIDIDGELVTPTGAAILATIASFALRPPMTVRSIGYGSGRSDFPFPNVLRVLVGEARSDQLPSAGVHAGSVVQLATNIDDMDPQIYEYVVERLLAAGALDVWTQPAGMKKGRPGTVLSALAPPDRADAVAEIILAETTSIGVRRWTASRVVLPRSIETVATALGPVRVKVVKSPSGVRAKAEYDDCRAIAQRNGMTLAEVIRRIDADIAAWLRNGATDA